MWTKIVIKTTAVNNLYVYEIGLDQLVFGHSDVYMHTTLSKTLKKVL